MQTVTPILHEEAFAIPASLRSLARAFLDPAERQETRPGVLERAALAAGVNLAPVSDTAWEVEVGPWGMHFQNLKPTLPVVVIAHPERDEQGRRRLTSARIPECFPDTGCVAPVALN